MQRLINLFLLVFLFPFSVQAETIAATYSSSGPVAPSYWYRYYVNTLPQFASYMDALNNQLNTGETFQTITVASFGVEGRKLNSSGQYVGDVYAAAACPAGSTNSIPSGIPSTATYCSGPSYTCPSGQNWSLSGTTCTRPDCTAGQTRDITGVCLGQCPAPGTSTPGITGSSYSVTSFTDGGDICMASGCYYNYTGCGSLDKVTWYCDIGKATGSSCSTSMVPSGGNTAAATNTTPATVATETANTCIRQGLCYGSVNGVIKCTTCASSVAVTTSTKTVDGATTTTQEKKTTDCIGTQCTTTVDKVATGPAGSTTTQDQITGTVPAEKQIFPSDYAKSGEANTAANSINNVLGAKLDKITETGTDPTDPAIPGTAQFDDAFFKNTFTGLLGWNLPAHSSACPTSGFTWNGVSYTVNSHCQLVQDHFNALSTVMTVIWSVLALFILLGA